MVITNKPTPSFLQAGCPSCRQTTSVQSTEVYQHRLLFATLQALHYLHKLCSHPALVLTEHHPQYSSVTANLQHAGSSLRDIQHAPKLVALQYVLYF